MLKSILALQNVQELSRDEQKKVFGGISDPDLSLCGCSCSGSVTGPAYCTKYIGCPQVDRC